MHVQASDLRPSGVSCSSNLVTGGNTVLIKDTGNHSDQERGAGARGHAHRGPCGGAGGGAGGAAGGPRPAETCRQRPHGVHRRSPPGPPLPQGTVDPTPATGDRPQSAGLRLLLPGPAGPTARCSAPPRAWLSATRGPDAPRRLRRRRRGMLTARGLRQAPAVAARGCSPGGRLQTWTLAARMLSEARGDIGRGRVQICLKQTQNKRGR